MAEVFHIDEGLALFWSLQSEISCWVNPSSTLKGQKTLDGLIPQYFFRAVKVHYSYFSHQAGT
jgi:hypothetical protein